MKKFIFCLLFSLITHTAFAATYTLNANPTNYLLNLSPSSFNRVDIKDGLNVSIDNQHANHALQIKGDSISINYVKWFVKNNTLYLSMKPNYPLKNGRLSVFVHMQNLIQISHSGDGQVVVKDEYGPIDVITTGRGTTKFTGDIILQNVSYNGSGTLAVDSITSTYVRIYGRGTGKVVLIGRVGQLDVNVGNRTWLNAYQLFVKRAFIKTSDNARADVWVKDNLSTLATGHSSIYYYHDAGFVGGYMKPPAVVLRMTGINLNESMPKPKPCCFAE